MQPFLSRASLTRRFPISYSCRLSKTANTNTGTTGCCNAGTTVDNCPLKRKFGEFYKRFYSAVSGVPTRDGEEQQHNRNPQRKNRGERGGEMVSERSAESRRMRKGQRPSQLHAEEFPDIQSNTGFMPSSDNSREHDYQRQPRIHSSPNTRGSHPRERTVSKEVLLSIEKSTVKLTSRFLEHDRLCRELRAKIAHQQIERSRVRTRYRTPESRSEAEDLRKSLAEEVELLKKTLAYITTHYYESTLASEIQTDPSTSPIPLLTPYFPPFPNYTSTNEVAALNRSIRLLLFTRPPLPALIPRICYNLLTSPSPPNVHTYNSLIQGLTQVRHSSLAHMVFRNMVESSIKPNEGTVARMVNLCIKSADRVGFERITKITAHRNMAMWWGFGSFRRRKTREQKARSKMVLESFIHGAARFGDVQQVRVWLRAMERECPEFPEPSLYLLTSLMRLWTEMKDWDSGLRAWKGLMRLDEDWRFNQTGNPMDIRAFHQMLKLCQACGQKEMHEGVLDLAIDRGFNREEVLASINKTKGLWVRRENKTPHIRGQRRNDESGGLEILDALKRAWDINTPLEYLKQHHRKYRPTSDATKSRVWQDVISRRMDDIRPASVSGGDIRQDLAEQRQQEIAQAVEESTGVNRGGRGEIKGEGMGLKERIMEVKEGVVGVEGKIVAKGRKGAIGEEEVNGRKEIKKGKVGTKGPWKVAKKRREERAKKARKGVDEGVVLAEGKKRVKEREIVKREGKVASKGRNPEAKQGNRKGRKGLEGKKGVKEGKAVATEGKVVDKARDSVAKEEKRENKEGKNEAKEQRTNTPTKLNSENKKGKGQVKQE